ncbi:MAG: hypothetical protein WD768_20810 [Phycisphaeraceae bacterium]
MDEVFLSSRVYSKETHQPLVTPDYARKRADTVRKSPLRKVTFDAIFNTCFLVVRDRAGNIAWGTHSINPPTAFGAGIVVEAINQPRFDLPMQNGNFYFESHYDDKVFEMLKERKISIFKGRPSPFTGLVGHWRWTTIRHFTSYKMVAPMATRWRINFLAGGKGAMYNRGTSPIDPA